MRILTAVAMMLFIVPALGEWKGSNTNEWDIVLFVAPDQRDINPELSCGEVVVSVDIAKNGAVDDSRIYSSNGDHLIEEVLRVSKLWKFRPELIDGEPIGIYGALIAVNFDCNSSDSWASIAGRGSLNK